MNPNFLNDQKICRHEKYEIIFMVSGVEVVSCRECSLVRAISKGSADQKEIYRNYYDQETGSRFNFGVEYIVKGFRFLRAIELYFLKPDARSILDVGSGRGWMLYFLKKYFKYTVAVGTQISVPAYEFSKEKLNLDIYNQDLLDVDLANNFDLITLWHVLEHVDSPEMYLQKIYALLKKDGLLVLEVPNFNSWTSILTKKHWLALDIKYHETFFTSATLRGLLEKQNFKIKNFNSFSLEQSAFTSAQSLINFITKTDNYFFQWLQKGGFDPRIIMHLGLFMALFPICLVIDLFLYYSQRGEVINIVAQKNDQ